MKTVYVADETLKVLSLERRAPLLFREKTALVTGLVATGANAVELPLFTGSREEEILLKTLAPLMKDCRLSLPVSGEEGIAEKAMRCLTAAEKPRLQVEFPVSAVLLEYKLRTKEEKALEKLAALVKNVSAVCADTEVILRDATGAREAFLLQACRTAEENGAAALTLYDDAGQFSPAETAALFETVLKAVSVPVYYRPNDTLSFGCANAFAALEAGAAGIKTALTCENALHTDKFAAAFAVKGPLMGAECSLNLTGIRSESGSLLKSLTSSEAKSGQLPASSADIFLDADSQPGDVEAAVSSLGYELSPEDIGRVTDVLHGICRKKSSVGAKELEAIVASAAMQVPSTYHVESYLISTGNLTASMASIHLTKNGEALTGVATGDGPIDSAFRAIEQCIGTHYELDEFSIDAVTEGKESLGSALVCLRNGGRRYAGNGVSADIVGASIRAYITALNKIAYEEDRA